MTKIAAAFPLCTATAILCMILCIIIIVIIMFSILLSVHFLLCSNAGCSRSVAIGICYALHKAVPGEVSVQKSLKELRLTRPAANPNQGFMQQLYAIEAKLNSL